MAVAALASETVQVLLVPDTSVVGVQTRDDSTFVDTVTETLCEPPLRDAVRVAFWSVVTGEVLAVNVAEVPLARTVTEAGTDRAVLLAERATVAPFAPAALFNVTVQVVEEPAGIFVGEH